MTQDDKIKKLKRYFAQHQNRLFVWHHADGEYVYFRFSEIKGSDVKIRQLTHWPCGKTDRFLSNSFPIKYFYEEWIQQRIRKTNALIFLDK